MEDARVKEQIENRRKPEILRNFLFDFFIETRMIVAVFFLCSLVIIT